MKNYRSICKIWQYFVKYPFLLIPFIVLVPEQSQAQDKIFFDVKTKLAEKYKLTHIKNAVDILILQTDWASVTEIGENYALWLKNYTKEAEGSSVTVSLDIEIRQPSAWREGELLEQQRVFVRYDYQKDIRRVSNHFQLFKQKFKNVSDKIILETTLMSEKIVNELFYMSRGLQ